MIFDLELPHEYELGIEDELLNGLDVRYFSESDSQSGSDGIIVKVGGASKRSWLGIFAFGMGTFSGVFAMPEKKTFCTVSRGIGYIVPVEFPEFWKMAECFPIVDVRVSVKHNIVIFADCTGLIAYGEMGLLWRTNRLAFDGLKITGITGNFVVGEYFDIRTEKIESFRVDLFNGSSTASQPPILW